MTPHAKDCSAFDPCEACSQIISNAKDARHEYDKALEILEELGSMPWLIKDGGSKTEDFWKVYEDLRYLRDNADRRIPRDFY